MSHGTPTLDPNLGQCVLSRYWLNCCIHRSKLSLVYTAYDHKGDREVVVKMSFEERAALIDWEAEALRRLNHRRIVKMLDYGCFDSSVNGWAVVTELLNGPDMDDVLEMQDTAARETKRPRGVTPLGAGLVISQVLEALDHAHANGIVHRDVKPANILWRHGEAVLIDFGLAEAWHEHGSGEWRGQGSATGTAEYAPPEQIRGDLPPHPTADIYSCGIVLYDLLTGSPPFQSRLGGNVGTTVDPVARAKADADIRRQHLEDDAVPIEWRVPGLRPELAAVVRTAMEKDPARRYQSAAEMLAALHAAFPH